MTVHIEDRMLRALTWWVERRGDQVTSGYLGTGAVADLERWFTQRTGQSESFAVGSGAAALLAVLQTIGIEGRAVVAERSHYEHLYPAIESLGALRVVDPAEAQVCGTHHLASAVVVRRLGTTKRTEPSIRPWIAIDDLSGLSAIQLSMTTPLVRDRPDFSIIGMGHGCALDVGDGGLVASGEGWGDLLCSRSQHALRQYVAQIPKIRTDLVVTPMHPCAAILALHLVSS